MGPAACWWGSSPTSGRPHWDERVSWQEVAGFVLGLINIVLLVRRSVWNFPVAMVMVSLVGVVLFRSRL